MNLQEAKELTIKKWQYIVNNNGDDKGLFSELPELLNLSGNCPYCELFLPKCEGCPIKPQIMSEDHIGCLTKGHPFLDWAFYPTKENAQLILNLIISH